MCVKIKTVNLLTLTVELQDNHDFELICSILSFDFKSQVLSIPPQVASRKLLLYDFCINSQRTSTSTGDFTSGGTVSKDIQDD